MLLTPDNCELQAVPQENGKYKARIWVMDISLPNGRYEWWSSQEFEDADRALESAKDHLNQNFPLYE